jgi:hypothetical protein
MNEITAPIIRFRHAADAIGVTKKTLRNWLARGQVSLETPSEGWSAFSRIDLMRLAITAELVSFGMGILPAFMTAGSAVDHATYLLASYRNTPAAALNHAFLGRQIAICRTPEGAWRIHHLRPQEEIDGEWLAAPSLLLVNLWELCRLVTERLVASLDDAANAEADDGSDPE